MLEAAKFEEGLIDLELPADLLSGLEGLDRETMARLLQKIQFNKERLGKLAAKLAELKLIDAELLAACEKAGKSPNTEALAAFLRESGGDCDSFSALGGLLLPGRDRSRPRRRADDLDRSLGRSGREVSGGSPAAVHPVSDAQFVGVSRAAPDLSGDDVVVEHGALAEARARGGSAHSQTVLPRHQSTVRRFFAREE